MKIKNKPLVDALESGNIEKVRKKLEKNRALLNAIIPSGKLNFTPLGYAIYYSQIKIVTLLLTFDSIVLNAGEALFTEAEEFAKIYCKHEIAELIANHKAKKLFVQAECRDKKNNEPEDTYANQIFLLLKAGNLDELEGMLDSHSPQDFIQDAAHVEIISKLISSLIMKKKLSRWIVSQDKKGESLQYGNRDDTLNEDKQEADRNKKRRDREIALIRKAIGCLNPKLKDADDEKLYMYFKEHQLKTKRTIGDESDDSDSEDEESLNSERVNSRTSQYKKILAITTADKFWYTTKRERQGGGLIEKLKKLTTSKDGIDKIKNVFNTKRNREEIEIPSGRNKKRFVAQFRGINYMQDRWNLSSRRNHYKMDEVGLPQFSESVLKTLPYNFYEDLGGDNDYCRDREVSNSLLVIAQNLKELLTALGGKKNPIVEPTVIGKNEPYLFNSITEWMQHGFTNGISQHLLDLKLHREQNKLQLGEHTLNSFNYAVSTSDCPNHALKYALGLKTYYADNFAVNYNQNGSLLNSHVGKIYIVLQESEEFKSPDYVRHVLRMAHEGKVPINKTGGIDIASELENDYIGYIPGEKVVVELRLKFPSFHKQYKKIYEIKYGLNKELYSLFGALIKSTWQQGEQGPDNQIHQAAIMLLKEWLCSYYEVLLLRMAQNKAQELGGSLVYIHHNGSEQTMPDHVPFINGDAHMPNRNRTRVLQNFRIIAAKHFSVEQYTNIDLMIKIAIEEHLAELVEGVVYEPTVPEGLSRIADSNAREYYLRINALSVTDLEKKKTITHDILKNHKGTFMWGTDPKAVVFNEDQIVQRPLLFSNKRIKTSVSKLTYEATNKRHKQENEASALNMQNASANPPTIMKM